MREISVREADFDPGALIAALEALGGGAVASFTGLVRGDGGLTAMRLDHYPAMTEKALAEIADRAEAMWPSLSGIVIVHRTGELKPGDRIVFVGTASAHRAAALEACAFLIDWLKVDAPFWKKEMFGSEGRWVEARSDDDDAATRWHR